MTRHECVQRPAGDHPTVARLHRLCDQDREPRQVASPEMRVNGRLLCLRDDGARAVLTVGRRVSVSGEHAFEAMQRACAFGLLSHPVILPIGTAGL